MRKLLVFMQSRMGPVKETAWKMQACTAASISPLPPCVQSVGHHPTCLLASHLHRSSRGSPAAVRLASFDCTARRQRAGPCLTLDPLQAPCLLAQQNLTALVCHLDPTPAPQSSSRGPCTAAAAHICTSRRGMLIKGGRVLDALTHVSTVAFDKTGTLTTGVLKCTSMLGLDSIGQTLAASGEAQSVRAVGLACNLQRCPS